MTQLYNIASHRENVGAIWNLKKQQKNPKQQKNKQTKTPVLYHLPIPGAE